MADIQTFDDFLNGIITDYQAQKPDVDIAPATLVFIKSAATASMLWGLQKQIEYCGKKPFPDLCNLDDLKHLAQIKSVQDIESYIDSDGNYSRLVDVVMSLFQNPPAAGNKYDWVRWSQGIQYDHTSYIETCVKAFQFENKRFSGSVDIAIVSDMTEEEGEEQEPSAELIAAVTAKLESERNLGIAKEFLVHAPEKVLQGVAMEVSDGEQNVTSDILAQMTADIIDYMKSVPVGGSFYPAQIEAIAINAGVNVESITPSVPVPVSSGPDTFERIWPDEDEIDITEAA
jgi:uncharacterized phage protein gp47/JayE